MKRKREERMWGMDGVKTNRRGTNDAGMNNEGTNDEGGGTLAREIRAVFPEMVPALSDAECAELAENLTLLPDEDVARYLPALMVGMAELSPERRPNSDLVGIFLDGAQLRREKDGSLAPRSDRSPFRDSRAAEPFARFTRAQSAAVLRFLREVLLPADPDAVYLASALAFWNNKAK